MIDALHCRCNPKPARHCRAQSATASQQPRLPAPATLRFAKDLRPGHRLVRSASRSRFARWPAICRGAWGRGSSARQLHLTGSGAPARIALGRVTCSRGRTEVCCREAASKLHKSHRDRASPGQIRMDQHLKAQVHVAAASSALWVASPRSNGAAIRVRRTGLGPIDGDHPSWRSARRHNDNDPTTRDLALMLTGPDFN